MNKFVKYGALAVFVGAGMNTAALADTAETKGGIKVKTDDGRFEASLNGRLHYDLNVIDQDDSAMVDSDIFFRRARVTLSGKAYGWGYKFETDFAGANKSVAKDLYVFTEALGGELLLGQFKPFQGMEELTSSNEITMMERPYASASGLRDKRQFGMGVGYKGAMDNVTYAFSAGSAQDEEDSIGARDSDKESLAASARVTFAPIMQDGQVVHVGASYGLEKSPGDETSFIAEVKVPSRAGTSVEIVKTGTDHAEVGTVGLEAAAVMGPFYAQAEYMTSTFEDKVAEADVNAYYVQASYHLTGESKPYKNGVFKSVKPVNSFGAIELTGRYDVIENDEVSDLDVSTITLGTNWYLNPNVRFMLNVSESDVGDAAAKLAGEKPRAVALRTQFSF